ncbi:unnamed protein product [Prunus brigantina]
MCAEPMIFIQPYVTCDATKQPSLSLSLPLPVPHHHHLLLLLLFSLSLSLSLCNSDRKSRGGDDIYSFCKTRPWKW